MSTMALGFEGAEIDVAGGIKPKFLGPKWSPNIGWVHYFYTPEDLSPDYGEIYAKTDYTFGEEDKFTLRGLVFFAPDYNQSGFTGTYVAGGGRVKLWKNIGVYAGVGYQFFEDPNAFEQLVWTAGASYYWKSLTFDVRYWDTNLSRQRMRRLEADLETAATRASLGLFPSIPHGRHCSRVDRLD